MHLLLELARHRDERAVREIGEPEVRIEGAAVVRLPARFRIRRPLVRHRRKRQVGNTKRVVGGSDRLVLRVDRDRPVAVRLAVRGNARRTMDRPDAGAWIRGKGGAVERRVLDVVAHADDARLAVRLDVHEGAAVVQPERTVLLVGELVADAHVLVHEADVELEPLHDRPDAVALDAHQPPHPGGVGRAGAEPLVDGDVVDGVDPGADCDLRHQGAVDEVPHHHVLEHHRDELIAGEITEVRHVA